MSTAEYKRNRGVDATFREHQRWCVVCPRCNTGLAHGSLKHHMQTQHGEATANFDNIKLPSLSTSYCVSFPQNSLNEALPCCWMLRQIAKLDNLQQYFPHRHPNPLPKCERCRMHVTPIAIRSSHQRTSLLCQTGIDHLQQLQTKETTHRSCEQVFTINDQPLTSVVIAKYLGQPLASVNNGWLALHQKLKPPQSLKAMGAGLSCIDGATPAIMGMFYKAVVQAILLYDCENWTIMPMMMKAMQGFHHKVGRRITCRLPKQRQDGSWDYPMMEDA